MEIRLDHMYSTREVADICRVTTKCVRDWITNGTLEAMQVGDGGHWMIYPSSLQRFLNKEVSHA